MFSLRYFIFLVISTTLICNSSSSVSATQNTSLSLLATLAIKADLVEIDQHYAYVAADNVLQIIDLSDRRNPSVIGSINTPGRIWSLHVDAPYIYVAGGLEGLHIINFTNAAYPVLVGTHTTPGQALAVSTSGTVAMVINLMTGLELVDITDKGNPILLFTQETPGYQWGIKGTGPYVYIVDQPSGLHLFDVSNPNAPVTVDFYQTDEPANDIIFGAGNRAYLTYARSRTIDILDVSDPSNLRRVGRYETPARFQNIAISGFNLMVPVSDEGLAVIDVSDSAQPTLRLSFNTSGTIQDVAVDNNLVAIADKENLILLRLE